MTEAAAHLPAQLTSFIGRDRELGEVRSLLAKTRPSTLTGAGGSGKTRLALEAAAEPETVALYERLKDGTAPLVEPPP